MALEIDKTIAEEATQIVSGVRNGAYGEPEDNFANIAAYWNAHLQSRYGPLLDSDIRLDAVDVSMMMIGMKLAREGFKPTRDNKVDAVGYILTLDRVERVVDLNNAYEKITPVEVEKKITHNEKDVKTAAKERKLLEDATREHSPSDHGSEFWSSLCPEPACVHERAKIEGLSYNQALHQVGRHESCGCPLESTQPWGW